MLAVIGGSGVYNIEGLRDKKWTKIESSFGEPSDELLIGELEGQDVCFLPAARSRAPHPAELRSTYRANIDALKRLGVTDIISVSAVGSLREHLAPGMFVIVDQFIDRTFAREKSFFGEGLVAHVSMARPVCRASGRAPARRRDGRRRSTSSRAGPTSSWKGRSSRPTPNRSSIARGTAT